MARAPADPHVHAEASVIGFSRLRTVLAGTLGRAPSVPASVATACGERRPLAGTSHLPERVTCLPCREHAGRAHAAWAASIDDLVVLLTGDAAALAHARTEAARHRDLAARFG